MVDMWGSSFPRFNRALRNPSCGENAALEGVEPQEPAPLPRLITFSQKHSIEEVNIIVRTTAREKTIADYGCCNGF